MTAHLLISLSVFMFIAAVTPGPNNLLLTASGAQYGFRRTLVLMAGIMLGMQTVLYLSAFGVAAITDLSQIAYCYENCRQSLPSVACQKTGHRAVSAS